MKYSDLRSFVSQLEATGDLKRIGVEVSPRLEMTEICDRVLRAGGPALLFERPKGHEIPVLANLFGTVRRVAAAMGVAPGDETHTALRQIGRLLAMLREPEPPKGLRDLWDKFPVWKQLLNMPPKSVSSAPAQEVVLEGKDVDLGRLPVQTCWPQDAGPLITWGLTVTRGPLKPRQNLGIYRQQVIGRNRIIMRWLAHRGGALDYRDHSLLSKDPFPVAVALGADPATMLAAVTPIPDTLSEYQFAGLLRGARTELAKCLGSDLEVPASAEIVLEGTIARDDVAQEGPAWRPHRLLQRSRALPGDDGATHDHAPLADLSLHLYRQAARRAGDPRRRAERAIRSAADQAIPGDRGLLSAAGGLLLPHGGGQHEEAIPGTRQARDVRHLELSAPVHVHQVHRGVRRRRRMCATGRK